jgi:signal transduction histidine kinase/CheY-like chemotaxis protein
MRTFRFWENLSVAKKIYLLIGSICVLVFLQFALLLGTLSTLSAVRAFVGGEGLWSKGQKESVVSLLQYAQTKNISYYYNFLNQLKVIHGDEQARRELLKDQPDSELVRQGFLMGQLHPDDIDGMEKLIVRFKKLYYLQEVLAIWEIGAVMTKEMEGYAEELRDNIERGEPIEKTLLKIEALNKKMTALEKEFSSTLGAASRWLEGKLFVFALVMIFVFLTLLAPLVISFARELSRGLIEVNDAAKRIGKRDFNISLPERSRDEVGQLARAMNKMAQDLESTIGKRQKAETANQLKSLFLANMSHEIRTPLGAILGFTEALKDTNITEEERLKFLAIIERTGESLTKIINDILDITKVESGHFEIEKSPILLSDLLTEVELMVERKKRNPDVKIEVIKEGFVPDYIITDPVRLKQILVNVVGNAVKFTEKGFVRVTYRLAESQIEFEVQDTGNGISSEQQSLLFRTFSQVDSSLSRKHEGTGLGLALAQKLANLLDGDVYLERSIPGYGSVFIVRVGLQIPQHQEAVVTSAIEDKQHLDANLSGKTVLVVDDVEDNRLLLNHMLKRRGIDVDFASNGEEAVKAAMAKSYDVIFMDIQMPVMDGYKATEILRASGYRKTIVALTAHAMKEDREKCLKSGCNDYLTKPVQLKALLRAIVRS